MQASWTRAARSYKWLSVPPLRTGGGGGLRGAPDFEASGAPDAGLGLGLMASGLEFGLGVKASDL